MNLKLERRWPCPDYTIGRLSVDGTYFCDTLEDTVRDLCVEKKVPAQTAVPAGTYRVAMDVVSPKYSNYGRYPWAKPYGGRVPRLVGVQHFQGILIHPGNTPADTAGCILVGHNKVKGQVLQSVFTFRRLMDEYLVPAELRGETITITIG